jgi:hypothetical protein
VFRFVPQNGQNPDLNAIFRHRNSQFFRYSRKNCVPHFATTVSTPKPFPFSGLEVSFCSSEQQAAYIVRACTVFDLAATEIFVWRNRVESDAAQIGS